MTTVLSGNDESPAASPAEAPENLSPHENVSTVKEHRISFFDRTAPSHPDDRKKLQESCSTVDDVRRSLSSADSLQVDPSEVPTIPSPLSHRSIDSDLLSSLSTDEFGRLTLSHSERGSSDEIIADEVREPLFRRVTEVLKRRREGHIQKSQEVLHQELQETTFHPAIDRKSRAMFKKKHAGEPPLVFERLSQVGRPNKALRASTGVELRKTARMKTHEVEKSMSDSFLPRMEIFQRKKKENLQKLEEQLAKQNTVQRQKLPKFYARLPARNDRPVESQNAGQTKHADKELTFRPELNRKSMRLAKDRTLHSLIENSSKKAMTMLDAASKEKERSTSLLEKLLLLKSPEYKPRQKSLGLYDAEAADNRRREREAQRQLMEKIRLEKEMQDCTFKPDTVVTNKTRGEGKLKKNSIGGLPRYFQRVALAQRLGSEQRERQRLVLGSRSL